MVKFSKQEQADFNFWKQDGNVSKNNDGTYSTQDAQYTNSLKDMDALKEYYFKEFLSGSRYAGGGEVEYEIKRIVNEAKNHKKNTHFAIHKPTNSIVFTWDYNNYDTKELNAHKDDYFYFDVKDIVSGNVDKYVKSDFSIVQRKDLEKRGIDLNNYLVFLGQKYDRSESKNESDGGEAGFDDEGTSMVMYHEKRGNFIIPKGQIYLWLYEGEKIGEKLQNEQYDWVFYPLTSHNMAFQSGYIPPLKRVWTKKFQKEHKGSEHLLGLIKAYLIEKEGKKELFIDMMSVNPTKIKKGIMSYMIKDLRDAFNLSQDQVTFSKLTKEGEKFIAKKKYSDGGETRDEIEDKIAGLKLRIAKTKKQISGYETTERGKYNKLFQEKVVPLQKELDTLSDLYGKSKYEKGGAIYPDLSLIKADVVNDSVVLDEFEIKKTKNTFTINGLENKKIKESSDIVRVLRSLWEKDTINAYEQSYVLYLNKSNNVIGYYHHSSGGIDGTIMDVQMISGMALKSLAKGVIIAHNHPSESTLPSDADKRITNQIKDALKVFNILLLDSIIITDESYFSFCDEGLI
jgi:DNA repair protein RadC